jgi:alpha-ketoglutarate-dependent taurine dioxygenase
MERVWAPGLSAPDNTYSHPWAEGDFVVWNNRTVMHSATGKGEKDAKLAQKLGQLQPFIVVSPQECTGQLASFGPT